MSKIGTILVRQIGKLRATLEVNLKDQLRQKLRELEKQCPGTAELNKIQRLAENVNRVVLSTEKQINQVQKSVKSIDTLASNVNRAIQVLLMISTPVAIIPPQTGGIGVPTSVLNRYSRNLNLLSEQARVLEGTSKGVQTVLNPLQLILGQTKALLGRLDQRLAQCRQQSRVSQNNEGSTLEIQTSDITLVGSQDTDITDTDSTGLQEIYKDYSIYVEVDPNSPSIAQRKFAIVKDGKGVFIYKGDPSFSKRNQILIDEARFEIDKISI